MAVACISFFWGRPAAAKERKDPSWPTGSVFPGLPRAVLTRVTLPGALFLTLIALLPFWVFDQFNVPFFFGGTALLIIVGVALDTTVQVQQHLHVRHYDDYMKQGKVKFRGRRRYM